MSKDEYYNSPEARLDTVLGRHKKYFELLRHIRTEYANDTSADLVPDFSDWLRDRYGIQLVFDSNGRITTEYRIVDEQKYLICKLKYPG
jgi:hypothetical protein